MKAIWTNPAAVRILVIVFFGAVSVALLNKSWNQSQDFRVFYRAAQRISSGDIDIYKTADANMPYKYAPAFAFVMVPFTLLPVRAAKTLWAVLSLWALLYSVLFLSKRLSGGQQYAGVAVMAILVNLQPVTDHFMDGQINCIILAAMILGFDLLFRGTRLSQAAGAGIIAAAASIKLYPLLIALYFLRKRDFTPLGYGSLAAVAVLAAPLLFVNISSLVQMYGAWGAILADSGNHLDLAGMKNQSIYGFLLRTLPNASTAHSLHLWLSAGVVAAAYFIVSKKKHSSFDTRFILDFSIIAFAMLLVCPLTWIHYYVFYMPFSVLLFGKIIYKGEKRGLWWVPFVLLLFCAVPTQAVTGTGVRNFFYRHSNYVFVTASLLVWCAMAGRKIDRPVRPSNFGER